MSDRRDEQTAPDLQEQTWVRVCNVEELGEGEIKRTNTKPAIAVYNVDGDYYATSDMCTHDKASFFEEGYLDGCEVECGWHFARFCIKSGQVKAPPATKPLDTYEVRVSEGDIYVLCPPRADSHHREGQGCADS